MRIGGQLLAIGIMGVMSVASLAQVDVEPYAQSDVKVDWLRGTDFAKYTTYAWGDRHQNKPFPGMDKQIGDEIDAALRGKGLRTVEMDANPDLVVAYYAGSKPEDVIQGYPLRSGTVKEATLVVQISDPQKKKPVWWGIADNVLTGTDKDFPMVQKKLSKMFKKFPPPAQK